MRIKLSIVLESNLHLLNKSVDITQKTNQLRILSRNEVEVIWNIYFDIIVLVPFTMFQTYVITLYNILNQEKQIIKKENNNKI